MSFTTKKINSNVSATAINLTDPASAYEYLEIPRGNTIQRVYPMAGGVRMGPYYGSYNTYGYYPFLLSASFNSTYTRLTVPTQWSLWEQNGTGKPSKFVGNTANRNFITAVSGITYNPANPVSGLGSPGNGYIEYQKELIYYQTWEERSANTTTVTTSGKDFSAYRRLEFLIGSSAGENIRCQVIKPPQYNSSYFCLESYWNAASNYEQYATFQMNNNWKEFKLVSSTTGNAGWQTGAANYATGSTGNRWCKLPICQIWGVL